MIPSPRRRLPFLLERAPVTFVFVLSCDAGGSGSGPEEVTKGRRRPRVRGAVSDPARASAGRPIGNCPGFVGSDVISSRVTRTVRERCQTHRFIICSSPDPATCHVRVLEPRETRGRGTCGCAVGRRRRRESAKQKRAASYPKKWGKTKMVGEEKIEPERQRAILEK